MVWFGFSESRMRRIETHLHDTYACRGCHFHVLGVVSLNIKHVTSKQGTTEHSFKWKEVCSNLPKHHTHTHTPSGSRRHAE